MAELAKQQIPPVRRQIVVPVAPAVAFQAFTADIGAWWPLAGHSVHGAKSTVAFTGGELVEESPDGRAVWGTVLEWAPPQKFRMTWHAGSDPSDATDLSVRFDEVGDGSRTLVTLEHSGWERLAERNGYAEGWIVVVRAYNEFAEANGHPDPESADDVWLALSHTPGPDAPADHNVMADPRIRQHFAFVSTLLSEGVLVAAGPLEGTAGHGMTVIRTAPGRVVEYVRRAQDEDPSVVGGLLQVDIRLWAVQLTP